MHHPKSTLLFILLFFNISVFSQKGISLDSILKTHPILLEISSNPNKFRLQIILTQIHTAPDGNKTFTHQTFNLNDSLYFYPASIVKLPVSIFSLERLHAGGMNSVDKYTRVLIDSSGGCQKKMFWDPLTNDSTASIAEYIEKALVVSDNVAYNRLYEFAGPEYINRRLSAMNMKRSVIRQRFASCNVKENRATNPFYFVSNNGDTLFKRPSEYYSGAYAKPMRDMEVKSFGIPSKKKKTKITSKDFSMNNTMPLMDIHSILMELIYPESQHFSFNITEEDRNFLIRHLSIQPSVTENSQLHKNPPYYDFMTNYIFYGSSAKSNDLKIDVCNIVGLAYGFATDVAYVNDKENNIEFFLSATVYVNYGGKTGYAYAQKGLPFLKQLGLSIYNSQLKK
jgi:hypothetical protein